VIPEGREALAARIAEFIRGHSEEPFGLLALDVHAWQVAHSPVAAALATTEVATWRELPAVPVDLFKRVTVGTVPEGQGVSFRTSGTTQGRRGVHRTWGTDLYDLGAEAWARACVPELPSRAHALLSDPLVHPDSSLSHMVEHLCTGASWYLGPDGVEIDRLEESLRCEDEPVFVPATAFALAEWLADGSPRLPEGSVVMVTGGFKGRVRSFDESTLFIEARRRFGGCRIVTEYGMTELSSQLWGEPGTAYRPPPWLHVVAVDPHTGAPRSADEVGQLRFVDLCNLDSAIAIETLDSGKVHIDGSVTLEGRLAGSGVRGCSLTVEEAWERGRRP
jgi:hypothetical protein